MTICEARRRLDNTYPVLREITTRVGDLDGHGHLNAIRLGQYYEDARASFYGVALAGTERGRVLVAQITTRFLGEGHWPAPLLVGTGISKVGRTSFEMVQGLFQDGRCLGLCETVLVNTSEGRPSPLADDVRAGLERILTLSQVRG